jgi:hypothetical protein
MFTGLAFPWTSYYDNGMIVGMVFEKMRKGEMLANIGRSGHGRDARATTGKKGLLPPAFCETKPFVMCVNAAGRVSV